MLGRRGHQQNERQTRHLDFPLAADKACIDIDNSLQETPADPVSCRLRHRNFPRSPVFPLM
jgi:hypothetical protein